MHLKTGSGSPEEKNFYVKRVNGTAKIPKITLIHLQQLSTAHQALTAKQNYIHKKLLLPLGVSMKTAGNQTD